MTGYWLGVLRLLGSRLRGCPYRVEGSAEHRDNVDHSQGRRRVRVCKGVDGLCGLSCPSMQLSTVRGFVAVVVMVSIVV